MPERSAHLRLELRGELASTPGESTRPAFLAAFMLLVFLVYGGWVLFRRPPRR